MKKLSELDPKPGDVFRRVGWTDGDDTYVGNLYTINAEGTRADHRSGHVTLDDDTGLFEVVSRAPRTVLLERDKRYSVSIEYVPDPKPKKPRTFQELVRRGKVRDGSKLRCVTGFPTAFTPGCEYLVVWNEPYSHLELTTNVVGSFTVTSAKFEVVKK